LRETLRDNLFSENLVLMPPPVVRASSAGSARRDSNSGNQRAFRGLIGRGEKIMTNSERSEDARPEEDSGVRQKIKEAAGEAFSKASETARDAGGKARRAATDAAATMSDHVMDVLNDQLGAGARSVGHVARAMNVAAEDLERESPLIAGLLRNSAENVDRYSDQLENQTVEGLFKATADATRRQPALMFGLAAVAGFFAFRTFRSAGASHMSSPPTQPGNGFHESERS
jgi:hypothetical protein